MGKRLTRPRPPTTTGKIERLHQTLQLELLNVRGPFASIEDAQAAMIGGQKIQVGLAHARKTVQVSVGPDTYQIDVEPGITVTAPRVGSREIRRRKASHYDRSADLEDR